MNSFAAGKLKEMVGLLQLLVTAMVNIDEETGKLNENQIYGILQSISGTDEERVGDINGTLQEQIKSLNDSINDLNTTLTSINANIDKTNAFLDYIDNVVSSTNEKAFIRVMLPTNASWQS